MPIRLILLADVPGTAPVHLSRPLRNFKKSGIMYLAKGILVITDIEEPIRIAGFDATCIHRRLNEAA